MSEKPGTIVEELGKDAQQGKFRSAPVKTWFLPRFIWQMYIMLRRNAILQLRFRASTLTQIFFVPFIVQLLLFVLQQADYAIQSTGNPRPPPSPLSGVPFCQGRNPGDPCVTFMYGPPTTEFTRIMTSFATKNAQRQGINLKIEPQVTDLKWKPNSVLGIVPVSDGDFIYNYVLNNLNTTRWGVTFSETTNPGAVPSRNIQYQVWFNSTLTSNSSDPYGRELLSIFRGLDEAILDYVGPTGSVSSNIDVTLKDWPKIPPSILADGVVSALGAVFFFCSEMVIFINVLNQVVTEKELKLRIAMEMAGLGPLAFWLSTFLSATGLVILNAFFVTIFGLIFQFNAFKNTHFMVLIFLFFLFGEAMIAFALFLTCFVRRARVAILIGIFIFIVGLIFESFVFSGAPLTYIWFDSTAIDPAIWKALIFLPFFNFGKMFVDIQQFTTGNYDFLTQQYTPGPGFGWDTLYTNLPDDLAPTSNAGPKFSPPPAVDSYKYLVMNIFFYFILALYFDQVIPNEFGQSKHILFFLDPSYWGFAVGDSKAKSDWLDKTLKSSGGITVEGVDEEVIKEKERACSKDEWPAVKIVNLRKVYRKSIFYRSPEDKIAVKDSCLTFQEGSLLALLGQNGAGKSTTMNILSGLTPATKGDALMYDYSVKRQMQNINEMMGVCPQHDILFMDLTAIEHIELYAGLKGVKKQDWMKLAEDRLKCVQLWNVRNARAGTYSGGMKRRLSMVIATIGDPKILFLDEPTTGMDPVNRRHVWSFIEDFKKGRVIVLTTHSMEEADVLGDRIAIMAHGAVRALGNSIGLKNKYGAGYRINLMVEADKAALAKETVIKKVPGVVVEDESAESIIFQFPNNSRSYIPDFITFLEASGSENGIKAWGISQTTLEEVFLRIIRDANPNGYSGYETTFGKKTN